MGCDAAIQIVNFARRLYGQRTEELWWNVRSFYFFLCPYYLPLLSFPVFFFSFFSFSFSFLYLLSPLLFLFQLLRSPFPRLPLLTIYPSLPSSLSFPSTFLAFFLAFLAFSFPFSASSHPPISILTPSLPAQHPQLARKHPTSQGSTTACSVRSSSSSTPSIMEHGDVPSATDDEIPFARRAREAGRRFTGG